MTNKTNLWRVGAREHDTHGSYFGLFGPDGARMADVGERATGLFIRDRVNAHGQLVAALRDCTASWDRYAKGVDPTDRRRIYAGHGSSVIAAILNARALLASLDTEDAAP